MKLTYFGHSAFLLEVSGARLALDPWLAHNPHGAVDPTSVPCDYVLCSHAHLDHMVDAVPLARAHGASGTYGAGHEGRRNERNLEFLSEFRRGGSQEKNP